MHEQVKYAYVYEYMGAFSVTTCSSAKGIDAPFSQLGEPEQFVAKKALAGELGAAIRERLSKSEMVDKLPRSDAARLAADQKKYADWISKCKKTFGVKTRRELFASLNLCHVRQDSKSIRLTPASREYKEGFFIAGRCRCGLGQRCDGC